MTKNAEKFAAGFRARAEALSLHDHRRSHVPSLQPDTAPAPRHWLPAVLPARSSLWSEFGLTVFERAERAGG